MYYDGIISGENSILHCLPGHSKFSSIYGNSFGGATILIFIGSNLLME
jgi:hypothetical protein